MITIIEGRDGVGKSSLALASQQPVLHPNDLGFMNHNDWKDDFVIAYTLKRSLPLDTDIVLDRSVISGLAYTFAGSFQDAILMFGRWRLVLGKSYRLRIVHIEADPKVRKERDSDAWLHDEVMIHDVDALTQAIAQKYHIDYLSIDTTKYVDVLEWKDQVWKEKMQA